MPDGGEITFDVAALVDRALRRLEAKDIEKSDATAASSTSMLPRVYRCSVHVSTRWPCAVAIATTDEGSGAAVDGSIYLTTEDIDVPVHSNPDRPRVLRSKLTLQGGAHGGSCHVDREFMVVVRPGDDLFIGLSEQGGVGVSVLRDGLLVIAAGAVSAVPLGRDVSVRIAADRWEEAIRNPDNISFDVPLRRLLVPINPGGRYEGEWPIEVRVASSEALWFKRNAALAGVHVFVKHGFRRIDAHRSAECVSLTRVPAGVRYGSSGYGPVIAANMSAFLLTADGFIEERR